MFADLGHFDVHAIQISFSFITFPASVCTYSGQAAYLTKFPDQIGNTFYNSIPDPIFWPTFVVAVSAAIIASQSTISGTYSIIQQSQSLGCFPSVKVVHTSEKYEVYIPEINYFLMISCVIDCAAFRTTYNIGHAYVVFVSMKSIPISKVGLDERFLFRQIQPKEYRIFRCVVRYGYNDVIGEPNEFEQQLVEQLREFIRDQNVTYLIEGVGGTDADQTNNNLFVSSQQQSNSDDVVKDRKGSSNRIAPAATSSYQGVVVSGASSDSIHSFGMTSRISNQNLQGVEEEISFVQRAMEKSVVYMLGEAEVVAEPNSSILKKIVVNHIYNFLRR
ncbi:hypothetical protein RYX36_034357 [Vicia faba]